MHYYQFSIGDYRRDTDHLSLIEHAIYRYLIDWYYLDECPIPKETQSVSRRLRLGSDSELTALQSVLADFFVLESDGWHHPRIDMDIASYHHKQKTNQANGKRGGRPKKTQSVILGYDSETETKANTKATINHKPITSNQDKTLFDALRHLVSLGVVEQVARDWIKQRKTKPTLTAIKGIEKEALKARLSLHQALEISCSRGWQSFKAEWIQDKTNTLTPNQSAWLTITGQTANFGDDNHGRTIEADPLPPALLG